MKHNDIENALDLSLTLIKAEINREMHIKNLKAEMWIFVKVY